MSIFGTGILMKRHVSLAGFQKWRSAATPEKISEEKKKLMNILRVMVSS